MKKCIAEISDAMSNQAISRILRFRYSNEIKPLPSFGNERSRPVFGKGMMNDLVIRRVPSFSLRCPSSGESWPCGLLCDASPIEETGWGQSSIETIDVKNSATIKDARIVPNPQREREKKSRDRYSKSIPTNEILRSNFRCIFSCIIG